MTNPSTHRRAYFAGAATTISLAVAALTLTGCLGIDGTSKQGQPFNDAPVSGKADTSPARVIAMPDGFTNVSIKCIAGTHSGVATSYHGDSPYGAIAVFTDPTVCP